MEHVLYSYRGRSARSAIAAVLSGLGVVMGRTQEWTLLVLIAGGVLVAAVLEWCLDPRGTLALEDGRITWRIDGRLAPVLGRREGSIPIRAIGTVERQVTRRGISTVVIRLRSGETFRLPPRLTPPAGVIDDAAADAGLMLTTRRRWL